MTDGCDDKGAQPRYLTLKVEGRRTILVEGAHPTTVLTSLTEAERAVAILAAEGLSNRQIAARRARSVRTVARQLSEIYHKLQIGSRAELAGLLASPQGDAHGRE